MKFSLILLVILLSSCGSPDYYNPKFKFKIGDKVMSTLDHSYKYIITDTIRELGCGCNSRSRLHYKVVNSYGKSSELPELLLEKVN